jgi:hypothetical protein
MTHSGAKHAPGFSASSEGKAGVRQALADAQGRHGTGARFTGIPVPGIYEIVSIQPVAGGVRTTQPHSETKKRPRGTGTGKQRASGTGDSGESEESEDSPDTCVTLGDTG